MHGTSERNVIASPSRRASYAQAAQFYLFELTVEQTQGMCTVPPSNLNKRLTMLFDPGTFLSGVFRRARGPACPAWGVGSTVRTSFVSGEREACSHLSLAKSAA